MSRVTSGVPKHFHLTQNHALVDPSLVSWHTMPSGKVPLPAEILKDLGGCCILTAVARQRAGRGTFSHFLPLQHRRRVGFSRAVSPPAAEAALFMRRWAYLPRGISAWHDYASRATHSENRINRNHDNSIRATNIKSIVRSVAIVGG